MEKTYNLRGIPASLWQSLKVIAAQRNLTIKAAIIAALTDWVQRNKEA
jgi:predicted DNA-binding ribbon-helix-helix protein